MSGIYGGGLGHPDAIGWTTRFNSNFDENQIAEPLFNRDDMYTGFQGRLVRLTSEAARSVLARAGRSPEEIDNSLTNRDVYLFRLTSSSGGGRPYLVEERSPQTVTVTAAILYRGVCTLAFETYSIYFEVNKQINVAGNVGYLDFDHPLTQKYPHPLRQQHGDQLAELESKAREWMARRQELSEKASDLNLSEEDRERALDELEKLEAEVNPWVDLQSALVDMVEPYLVKVSFNS